VNIYHEIRLTQAARCGRCFQACKIGAIAIRKLDTKATAHPECATGIKSTVLTDLEFQILSVLRGRNTATPLEKLIAKAQDIAAKRKRRHIPPLHVEPNETLRAQLKREILQLARERENFSIRAIRDEKKFQCYSHEVLWLAAEDLVGERLLTKQKTGRENLYTLCKQEARA
jgi:ferredoxin